MPPPNIFHATVTTGATGFRGRGSMGGAANPCPAEKSIRGIPCCSCGDWECEKQLFTFFGYMLLPCHCPAHEMATVDPARIFKYVVRINQSTGKQNGMVKSTMIAAISSIMEAWPIYGSIGVGLGSWYVRAFSRKPSQAEDFSRTLEVWLCAIG